MTKQHKTAIVVAMIVLVVMAFITFIRSGTSW